MLCNHSFVFGTGPTRISAARHVTNQRPSRHVTNRSPSRHKRRHNVKVYGICDLGRYLTILAVLLRPLVAQETAIDEQPSPASQVRSGQVSARAPNRRTKSAGFLTNHIGRLQLFDFYGTFGDFYGRRITHVEKFAGNRSYKHPIRDCGLRIRDNDAKGVTRLEVCRLENQSWMTSGSRSPMA